MPPLSHTLILLSLHVPADAGRGGIWARLPSKSTPSTSFQLQLAEIWSVGPTMYPSARPASHKIFCMLAHLLESEGVVKRCCGYGLSIWCVAGGWVRFAIMAAFPSCCLPPGLFFSPLQCRHAGLLPAHVSSIPVVHHLSGPPSQWPTISVVHHLSGPAFQWSTAGWDAIFKSVPSANRVHHTAHLAVLASFASGLLNGVPLAQGGGHRCPLCTSSGAGSGGAADGEVRVRTRSLLETGTVAGPSHLLQHLASAHPLLLLQVLHTRQTLGNAAGSSGNGAGARCPLGCPECGSGGGGPSRTTATGLHAGRRHAHRLTALAPVAAAETPMLPALAWGVGGVGVGGGVGSIGGGDGGGIGVGDCGDGGGGGHGGG
eukprot:356890-Chlamydomonas_euryale.AAC.2